jgi:ABC-2 type transport system permease protein
MPVHERGYTRWQSSGLAADPVWWVIARRGLSGSLRHRWIMLLVVLAWLPAVIKGVGIYGKARAGDLIEAVGVGGDWISITAGGFLAFIEGQRFFVFLLTMILGAGLIAKDRRENGLALYFARPLGLNDYLVGKSLIILGGYLVVTLAPALLLCLFSYLVVPGVGGLELLLWTPLRLAIFCMFTGLGLSLLLLALSSLAERTVLVVVWWAVLCLGGETVGNIGQALGLSSLQYVNFLGHWHNAGSLLLGTDPRLPVDPWSSLLLCLLSVGGALAVLRARIRPVEVVA